MPDDLFGLEVHPAAALFPMMSMDELSELAEDIKANGLVHPIVLDASGEVLIDGRNRLKACEIAGVPPRFENLNGHDPLAYIVSANLARRNLTKGQQAMALACIYPEPQQGKRSTSSATKEVSGARLSLARTVLRHSRELALNVLAGGGISLDEACRQVELAQGADANLRRRVAKLRAERPDLATAVEEGALAIADAEAKAKADADARKQLRWAETTNLIDAVRLLDRDTDAAAVVELFDASIADQRGEAVNLARLQRAQEFLTALIAHWGDADATIGD